jgi:PTS system mannitol-specific IIC component
MESTEKGKSGSREGLQKFGRFLSGMVMPNIGAFIAWGLITALFIPTGWLPNENLSTLVGPMIVYLLPLLIGYTGGKMVYGTRGGVLGAVATMGIIVGTSIPMFIGGMIMGPLAGYVIKKFDESVEGKVPTGFEMLVNNFSAGILGMALTLLAYVGIGPVVEGMSNSLGSGVEAFVGAGLLPLASIFIEPAKILFLNNAINHGVLSPLGIEQAAEAGKSIFFLLETNPGPGLGILLAYWVFAKGMVKQSAPGAIIIHFFGGIHEIYFPYILMQPSLLLAVIAGGASGVFTFVITGAGLVASPSPGSIFALSALAPRGGLIPVLAGVVVSAGISFLVSAVLINKKGEHEDALTKAKENVSQMKNSNKTQIMNKIDEDLDLSQVKTIAVACDAGMGSSAMGASKLKAALKDAKVNMEVINCSIDQLDEQSDLVITHEKLTKRANSVVPGAIHISISDFINTDIYDRLAVRLAEFQPSSVDAIESEDIYQPLKKQNIRIGLPSNSKEEAIRMAGQILFEGGYVEEGYIDAMVQRDSELSTYIGNGTAIPHGVSEAKKKIIKTGISILQFPEGVDFSGNTVYLVVGIAGVGNEHLMILSNLAEIVEDEEKIKQLSQTTDIDYIYKQFTN